MRVGSDYDIAGQHQALLRQQAMLNTHLPDFKVIFYPFGPGEFTHDFALLGGFNILVGCEVVGNQHNLFPVIYFFFSQLFKFGNSHRSSDVIAQDDIDPAVDQFTRFHRLFSGMVSQDLLCYRHSHILRSSFPGG